MFQNARTSSRRRRRSVSAVVMTLIVQMISGCHPAMTSSATQNTTEAVSVDRPYTGTVADWPLFFKRHLFGAVCFDTRSCAVMYDGQDHGTATQTPSADSIPPERYNALMVARYGDLPNFPGPAKLRWRAEDGSEHTAEIDFAEIFADSLVRHNVAREDVSEGVSMGFTHVLLEVNDRTVNVYTRTMIPTRREQIPGNKYSFFRDELIKVYSHSD